IPVLRGKAFYYLMAHRTLYLGRGSLIVGEKGPKPWAAPTFPELCCHTLEDFDTLNSRERVFFRVTDEDKRIQRDVIIPYWKDRAMLTKMNGLLPRAWQKLFAAGMFTEFLQQRGPGHTVADGKIYRKGSISCGTSRNAWPASISITIWMPWKNGTNGKVWPGSAGA
ncbi:pyruvate formate lyase family protein, partial [Megasphaera sp.]